MSCVGLWWPGVCPWPRSHFEQSAGTNVQERTNDASMANATAIASGLNRNPLTPGVRATGHSTMMSASVATITGIVSSVVASAAATAGALPMPRCRCVFSSTTIALSTSGPMARNSPPRVITLIVCPVVFSPMIAPMIASGSDIDAISVIFQSPRKIRIMIETRIAPMMPSSIRLSIALRTYSDWSKTYSSLLPSGSSDSICGMAAFTPSATARLLDPACR